MQRTLIAITVNVIQNIIIAIIIPIGHNGILIFYGKGVVLTLKIIGNGVAVLYNCITVTADNCHITFSITGKTLGVFRSPDR